MSQSLVTSRNFKDIEFKSKAIKDDTIRTKISTNILQENVRQITGVSRELDCIKCEPHHMKELRMNHVSRVELSGVDHAMHELNTARKSFQSCDNGNGKTESRADEEMQEK